MRNFLLLFLLLGVLMTSCQDNLVYTEFRPTANGKWLADEVMKFDIAEMDSLQGHNLFINIRNDETFEFSNLFLITEFEHPNGETIRDTLEYVMTKPDGNWLGTGYGSIKENKLWYKENIVFKDSGVYKVRVSHAMRKNGDVEGIQMLEGITDVGIQIEEIQ
ncbi:MAG: gliding motility lipoprotein GldH [Allomuricauda sp.]|nr:MAG: gliding motility lipoprotein GldH [Allomuricauda sp.]